MIHNIVSALNWGIAKDEPLHQALKGLAGKRLRIVFPIGGSVDWEIEADGLLKEVGVQTKYSTASTSGISSAPKAPDVTITIQTICPRDCGSRGTRLWPRNSARSSN